MHKLYLTGLTREHGETYAIYLHLWHKVRVVRPYRGASSLTLTISEYHNELLKIGKSITQATILCNSLGKLSFPSPKLRLVPLPPPPKLSPQPPITGT